MDKEVLIKSISQKGLKNSLISIYYNIGRALPFRAQRFPDGRDSPWYRSQFVEVHEVKPSGKGGKYGEAFGFYFRKGERADATENDPEHSWCRKTDTEPQAIPCAACGSWVLLDILGEPTAEPTKIYTIKDVLESGKHKGEKLVDVIRSDWNWVKWANENAEHFFFNVDKIMAEHEKTIKHYHPEDILTFGKYKGQSIKDIAQKDVGYLKWLAKNSEDFIFDVNEIELIFSNVSEG